MELNAAELSELTGKDPSTIRSWVRRGMPCIVKPKKGTQGRFSVPVALHWRTGDVWARKSRVDLTAAQKIVVSYVLDVETLGKEDRRLFADLVTAAGLDDDPGELLGFATGLLKHTA